MSESDVEIFINGELVGKGTTIVTVPKKDCVTVIIIKTGYLTERVEFCNKKNITKPQKSYYVEMKRDDASIQTDIANIGCNRQKGGCFYDISIFNFFISVIRVKKVHPRNIRQHNKTF